MECRIVERTLVDGSTTYVIQQKHFLFRWKWVDACVNASNIGCKCSFSTLEVAKSNLCYFDGSKSVDRVVD